MLKQTADNIYIATAAITADICYCVLSLQQNQKLVLSNTASTSAINGVSIYCNPKDLSLFSTPEYNLLKLFTNETAEIPADKFIRETFHQIAELEATPPHNIKALAMIVQIIIHADEIQQAAAAQLCDIKAANKKENPKINDIITYINANINRKITQAEIGKKFFINKFYLCHLFKASTGKTITEFIATKKIDAAKKMLDENITPMDVCAQLGFDEYTNFYRLFKKHTGLSPREYKM